MMFINITDENNIDYWINPDHIVSCSDEESGGSIVALSNGKWIACSESADEISDYILDRLKEDN